VLGRHSGRHAVQSRCETLGMALSPGEIDQVYRAVISLGEHRKSIGDGDLHRIIDRVRTPASAAAALNTAPVETVGYGHGV
jgi:2-isopropylmalate synthase